MPGQTVVGIGHPLANKLYSRALFNETTRKNGFSGKLIGPAPKQGVAERKSKMQTSPNYPFVRVNDLSKTAGDRVSVDLFNDIEGKPVMGDTKLAGKMMNLTSDSMDVYINQCRGGLDTGGRMTQQRTLHNLRSLSKAKLVGWNARLEDQLCLVHAAGARGYDAGRDWVVPLASDPDFGDIVVNAVLPPTRNRRLFGGNGATSVANLDTSDSLLLGTIDLSRALLDEMAYPMTPVRIEGDKAADEDPLYCLFVTSRQWDLLQSATGATAWRTFLQNAHDRSTLVKHPLFLGQRGMWNGILIKKLWRPIRFPAGSNVQEYDANDVSQTAVAAVDTDRALLLGAEAVGIVYGRHQDSDFYYNWHEEKSDHANTLEVSTAAMSGKSKIRFLGTDGEQTDHGVMTIDSYAPDPRTVTRA